jgi:ABC-type phosphate/phosphonate transport system permease subunit
MKDPELYNELLFYTLSHTGENFIHQHAVDAYTAQAADDNTKPIAIFFALAGLYLFIEKGYTGKQVQQAHLQMAKKSKDFISIILPASRGTITVKDVVDSPAGVGRDEMIQQWCMAVWATFANQHDKIILATEKLL